MESADDQDAVLQVLYANFGCFALLTAHKLQIFKLFETESRCEQVGHTKSPDGDPTDACRSPVRGKVGRPLYTGRPCPQLPGRKQPYLSWRDARFCSGHAFDVHGRKPRELCSFG